MTKIIKNIYSVLVPLLCAAAIGVSCEKQELIPQDDKHVEWMQEPIDVVLHINGDPKPRMTKMQANNKTRTLVQHFGSYSVTHTATPDYITVDEIPNTRTTVTPPTPPVEADGEKNVNDLNIFFFYHHEQPDTGIEGQVDNMLAHHEYFVYNIDPNAENNIIENKITIPKVRVGRYNILVMANVGEDMSLDKVKFPKLTNEYKYGEENTNVTRYRDLTQWSYVLPYPDDYNKKGANDPYNFPMRYRSLDEFSEGIIIQHDDKYTNEDPLEDPLKAPLEINLTRLLAKVVFSYDCSEIKGLTGVTTRGYGVNNLPKSCVPFNTEEFVNSTEFYKDIELLESENVPHSGAKTFYLPANHAGTREGLTQDKRTLAASPKTATYTSFTIKGTPTTGGSLDISYPLFLGNPKESTTGLFEDFNVQMGYNYNVKLTINEFDDNDHRLVYTKIEPLFNGDIKTNGEVTFACKDVATGEITEATEFKKKTQYFVDVLIDAKGANNQNFTIMAAITENTIKVKQRIVELEPDDQNSDKWLAEKFITESNSDQVPYPSEDYSTAIPTLTYNGDRLKFNATEQKIKRAFRLYFNYDTNDDPPGLGVNVICRYSITNGQSGLESDLKVAKIVIKR